MALSTITILITLPMIFSILEFEASCTNRSLINQLVSSDFVAMICYILMVHTPLLVRHLVGPFPVILCQFDFLIKNVITLKVMFSLNFRSITRYIFVFKSKNPTAIQDDFWVKFLVTWSVGCSMICQATLLFYPGREPMTFYFCVGKMPRALVDTNVKNNALFNILALVTLASLIFVHTRLLIHKYKTKQKLAPSLNPQINDSNKSKYIWMEKISQDTLFSLASNVIAIIILGMSGVAPSIINRTNPNMIDAYPNYLWVYIHQHVTTSIGFSVINAYFFIKKPLLRKLHVRNMKDILFSIKRSFIG